MIIPSTRQAEVIASATKTVYWTFKIQDNLGTVYYWSTGTITGGTGAYTGNFLDAPNVYQAGEWNIPHEFKIINFSGITLRRGKSESGIHAPNDVTFSIINNGNLYAAENFTGGTVRIGLVINDGSGAELCGSWRFRIKTASPYDQQIDIGCEDFLQEYLKGSYPNTKLISSLYPSTYGVVNDTVCLPEAYGTCYVPLRSVYASGARYYVLGTLPETFTISEVRSPRELGAKIVWTSAGYSFTQSAVGSYRMFQPIIADSNLDGAADAPGVWVSGDRILDMPTKFSATSTATVTNPADVIRRVLRNMGVQDYDLNLTSFFTAKDTFTSWGLTWNFAFWYKQDRAAVLSNLLAMCHSCLIVGEQIELRVLSKTSRDTITTADVLKMSDAGLDTFKYSMTSLEKVSDSGYVGYQVSGESQDEFLTALVPAKSTTAVIDSETIIFPGVQNKTHVQKLGTLYYQRKFLKTADISFSSKGTLLALRPDDVITISEDDYGGTYNVLIDEMTINADVSIGFSCQRFSEAFDDWGDLFPGNITVGTVVPTGTYAPVVSGPDGTSTTGTLVNSLPGRLRVGASTNYILLEPASPIRISLYSADTERLRIGNLNGFLGYVTDTFGLGIGSTAKYMKYDPTNGLRLGGSGVARIELDLELARISVKDATDATKTAMGYLNGLAKHDGTGNWGAGDYGFWAAQGDQLRIDGDAVYESGDWIVENDGSYLINNAADQTIVRLGTVNGVKGLYVYDATTPTQLLLAKFATDGMYLGLPGETTNYMKYTPGGGLVIRGGLNADDITAGSLSAARIAAGTISIGQLNFTPVADSNVVATINSSSEGIQINASKVTISGVGAALNKDPNCTDISAWEEFTGTVTKQTITDGVVGNTCLRSGAGADAYVYEAATYPVDPNKVYRVKVWARESSSPACDGTFYLLVDLLDSNGDHIAGDGTFWYYPASNVSLSTSWTSYTGWFGTGTSKGAVPANARMMRVGVLMNWGGTTGYQEIQDIRIEEVIPSDLVVTGGITAAKLSFSTLAGLNAGEGAKLSGIATGADVTVSAISGGLLSITGGGLSLASGGAVIKSSNHAVPTGTEQGTGFQLSSDGNLDAYGTSQTFGGTCVITDGNYMVTIGKLLTATGLVTHYPANNGTYLTSDGQIHIYKWSGSAWVESINIGQKTDGADYWVADVTPPTATRQHGIRVTANGSSSYGVYASAMKPIHGTNVGLSNAVAAVTGLGDYYGGQFTGGNTAGGAIILTPSSSAAPPSHLADRGTVWIASGGNPFINVTGGSGNSAWRTLGVASEDLSSYALADGSMCSFYVGGTYYLYARINSSWQTVWSYAP